MEEAISKRKTELRVQRVIDCESDQKKMFSLIHSLLGSKKNTVLPEYTSSFTLASTINMFFIDKISTIIFLTLIKKQGLDSEILKNYRPVANLSFISKIIEKAIAIQIHDHLINNDIVASSDLYLSSSSNLTFLLLYYYGIYSYFFTVNSFSLKYDHLRIFCIFFMEFYSL